MSDSFTVRPFSGAHYHKNEDRCPQDAWPCAICGKATINAIQWARVCGGGARWCDSDQEECPHGGDMGCFPIGADCARKFRVRHAKVMA